MTFVPESKLEKIGCACFQESGVQHISIPGTVRTVENDTFRNCLALKQVMLNEGIEVLQSAFAGSGLEMISFPSTLTAITYGALSRCPNLKTVWIKEGCTEAVRNNIADSVVVLKSCIPVGKAHLGDLRKLKNVEIPSGVKAIKSYWFYGTEIEEVTVPKSVATIEQSAFQECRELRKITFERGNKLEKIGSRSFEDTSIERFALPTLPKEIGEDAFLVRPQVQDPQVLLPNGIKVIPELLFSKTGVRCVVFPASLEEVQEKAFFKCAVLKKIVLPDNGALTTIRSQAFKGTVIAVFNVPKSLKVIEAEAFADSGIQDVILPRFGPEIDETAFNGCAPVLAKTLFVPRSTEIIKAA